MKLTIGFSPCPNDTFIFDALVNGKIDTEGLDFEPVLEDVETLNQLALQGRLDITKLSFPAFFQSTENYILLNAGSALGKGVGPLIVSKKTGITAAQLSDPAAGNSFRTVLPGEHTTAHLLFSFAFPGITNKTFRIFSGIEDAVLNDEADLGVIIHENRFTYEAKGLNKVMDLGNYWEQQMNTPVPLGGIAVKNSIKRSVALKIDKLVRQSLENAFQHYPFIADYVKLHSQSMSEQVMRSHIDLYVNNYSLNLGDDGKQAIKTLFAIFQKLNPQADNNEDELFL